MSSLVPDQGVRVLLELLSSGDRGARYRVELHAPTASWRGAAAISPDGAIALEPFAPLRGEGAPDAWMIEQARAFLRTLHKNHAADGSYPRRLLRWRDRR